MEFDFPQSVPKIEEVPKDFQALYEAGEDDKHVLKSDDFSKSAISAVAGLNHSLKASRAEVKDLKTQKKPVDLSALKDYGDTPEKIAEKFKEQLTEAGKGKQSQEDINRQVTKIKGDLSKEYETKLETAKTEKQTLRDQLYAHLVTSEAKTALAEAGAIDSDLALPFIKQQVKVSEADGRFSVHVVDKAGDPRYSGSTSSPLSVKELVAELKLNEKYGQLFRSEAPGGGGTPPGGPTPKKGDDKDKAPIDKIKDGLAKRRQGHRR